MLLFFNLDLELNCVSADFKVRLNFQSEADMDKKGRFRSETI